VGAQPELRLGGGGYTRRAIVAEVQPTTQPRKKIRTPSCVLLLAVIASTIHRIAHTIAHAMP
jgi:hypothetical protein